MEVQDEIGGLQGLIETSIGPWAARSGVQGRMVNCG